MKLSKNSGGDFAPHPETDGPIQAVIVDVTPLKKVDTAYGPKEKFRLVFETAMKRDDGTNWHVWSSGYTPTLNEKATFRKDLKRMFGRDLTAQEENEFDTESLIGLPVSLIIVHEHKDDKTYANIAFMAPDKSGKPLQPCGKYIRVQDREGKGGGAEQGEKAGYRRAEQDAEAGRDDWQKTKVHVGKHAGVDLGDLDADAVKNLIEKWLPKHKENTKPTADDKRLAAALVEAEKLLAAPAAADEDY
jgi:hypothetical protein